MVIQCRVCKKIRDQARFRHPWPGELPLSVKETFCPDCAREALNAIQRGEVPIVYHQAKRPIPA
ncbi:MAG: hypothetical protein ACYTGH_05075 [Planctomycetota bacterium]|jgi:hypothetical protein